MATSPAPEQIGFRGPQVCKLVGITYRQLDYWARTDLLRPSLADAAGSGTQRLYSYHDVLSLKVIKKFLDAGLALPAARRAVEALRQAGDDLASANIVLSAEIKCICKSRNNKPVRVIIDEMKLILGSTPAPNKIAGAQIYFCHLAVVT